MKKYFIFILLILIPLNVKALDLNTSSKNIILYNLNSGEILYEKDADDKVQVASLTKIMTAIITLENVDDLDKQITIKKEYLQGLTEANLVTAGFKVGQIVTYRDLLYGLLLPSGADAAKALSKNVTSSEEKFISLMNEKVKELDLKNTNFSNIIGLDDENNYSTAREISAIFRYALNIDEFKSIITADHYTTSDGKLVFNSTIKRNAKKYNIRIPYILGGKTGTTTGAGLCLATIAKEKNIYYMLVTLGALYDKKSPHHIEDSKEIYDYFINNYGNHKIVDKNISFKTIGTRYLKQNKIDLYPSKDVIKYVPNNYSKDDINYEYDGINEVTPFTRKDAGILKIYYKDELIDTQKIYLNGIYNISIIKVLKSFWFIIPIIISLFILIKYKRARK